ncbi:hypothetical protein IL992_22275 [Microbispora sp. NEAU-D428]|uniref:hypothetical protein n=1 Tax=Microbispora sitophila TaxID=2771537 RepID=UPI001866C5F0|nr:hypothetical protein [Microbispora sitophila]MBE3011904.1 hypothetical protein [Microbispora sitophila]
MALRLRGIISISLLAGLSLSACTEPAPKLPTAAQVEPTLKSHVDLTIKNAIGKNVKVTDPGGKDIPCGNGRYKRTYAVKARSLWNSDSDMLTTALIGALDYVAKYKLTGAREDLTKQEAVSPEYHTKIILSSPSKGQMVVRGETECLPTNR